MSTELQTGCAVQVFSQDDWWEAHVVQVKEGQVKVHYVGGADDEDEWFPVTSDSLRVTGSGTQPVGGPTNSGLKKRVREQAAEPVPVPQSLSFKRGSYKEKQGNRKQWKNLKKILDGEGYERLPLDSATYSSLEAPPSLLPPKKYCDITGLRANYTDPKTQIRYYSAREYQIIRYAQDHTVQELLKFRNAIVQLK